MKTFAKIGTLSLSVPAAVFVFDQTTGQAMSMNGGAAALLSRFKLDKADRLSLAVIERSIMADARTTGDAAANDGLIGEACELRRVARQPDGNVLALSRVWAPGVNTMLVVEDITVVVQAARAKRVWGMIASHMDTSDNLVEALSCALQVFCLLTASSCGAIWLSDTKGLTRRSMRVSSQVASTASATASHLKSPDDSAVGRAWSSATTQRIDAQVAIPLHAGGDLVAVLALDMSSRCPSEHMALSLIESLAPLFGLALAHLRARDALRTTKLDHSFEAEGASVTRSKSRPKASSEPTELRVAG